MEFIDWWSTTIHCILPHNCISWFIGSICLIFWFLTQHLSNDCCHENLFIPKIFFAALKWQWQLTALGSKFLPLILWIKTYWISITTRSPTVLQHYSIVIIRYMCVAANKNRHLYKFFWMDRILSSEKNHWVQVVHELYE